MRFFAFVTLLVLMACGSPTSPDKASHPKLVPTRLDVVSGDHQTARVTDTLRGLDIQVLSTNGSLSISRGSSVNLDVAAGIPVAGQFVTFATTPDCGEPYTIAGQTDSTGHIKNAWTLGIVAKSCVMEVRAVDQVTGEPLVKSTVTATVTPDSISTYTRNYKNQLNVLTLGDTFDIRNVLQVVEFKDQYGNVIPATDYHFAWTLTPDSVTTSPDTFEQSGNLVTPTATGSYFVWVNIRGDHYQISLMVVAPDTP
jgi:hypothetical protein